VGKPIDQWLYHEATRILDAYGNHPSFLLLSMGNEPAGPQRGAKYLGPWVKHFKAKTDRQLVTAGSGWPSIPENEYHVTPRPRIQQWGQGLSSRINSQPPATTADYRDFIQQYDVPVISHEIGQWCVYPNFDEMPKYTGALKPRNFEIFRELLDNAHMLDQAHDFLMASGKLQTLCYKEEIESALRTPGFGGFELLDLHDFPGQGTALVGVLDPFWDSKPYVSPQEFSHFCGPTVPLARMAKRMYTTGEALTAGIEIAHFGPLAMHGATTRWRILQGDKVLKQGTLPSADLPTGKLTKLGQMEQALKGLPAPAQLVLQVTVADGDQAVANDWDFWVYPEPTATHPTAAGSDVLVTHALDKDTEQRLRQGGTVVLMAAPNSVRTDVRIGFSSIFWNTAWTGGQAPHTLGILCDPKHPAFNAFPTEYHSNWQWWSIVTQSKPMVMDALPPALRPLLQVVPDWFRPQRLGLVFEAKVYGGKILVCSVDLEHDLAARLAARQLRRSLLGYVASPQFAPRIEVSSDQIRSLFREPTRLQRIGATIRADSQQQGYPAGNAIDGDAKTIWHTDWEPSPAPMPHALTLDLRQPMRIAGIRYLPRQDMTNGRIAQYAVSVSDDNQNWGEPVATGEFPDGKAAQVIRFSSPRTARYVKLVITREVNGRPFASVAEIDIIPAP